MQARLATFAIAALGVACKKAPLPLPEAGVAEIHAAEIEPARGLVEVVEVPSDKSVLVVAGPRMPILYLHGMCSEPRSDVEAWGASVSRHGTVIALQGDQPCPERGGTSWSSSAQAMNERIGAAIEAVSQRTELDAGEILVIGESMGASRAIALASKYPERYTRLVLVGGPETPAAKDLARVKAVALLAGEKEPQEKMRQGALGLESAGIDARFWELADATHGTYGSDGARAMSESVAYVMSR
jgi:pimeloyl-ACP methyl ester carboxylesterase